MRLLSIVMGLDIRSNKDLHIHVLGGAKRKKRMFSFK